MEELQHDPKKLSKKQKALIVEAGEILSDAEQQHKNNTDWKTIADLVVQGATVVMQLLRWNGG